MSDRSKNTMELELGLEFDDIISGKDEPKAPAKKPERPVNNPDAPAKKPEADHVASVAPEKTAPKAKNVIRTENDVLSSVADFLNAPPEEDEPADIEEIAPAESKPFKTAEKTAAEETAEKVFSVPATTEEIAEEIGSYISEPVLEEPETVPAAVKPAEEKKPVTAPEKSDTAPVTAKQTEKAKPVELPKKQAEKITVKEAEPEKNVFADDAEIPEEIFVPAPPAKDDDEIIDEPDPRIEEELTKEKPLPIKAVGKTADPESKSAKPEIKIAQSKKKTSVFSPALSRSLDRMIAILPLIAWAVYAYGARILITVAISAVSFAVFDLLLDLVLNRKTDIASGDSVFCGMVVALVFPPVISPLVILFVTFCAAVIKHIFNRNGLVAFNPYATSVSLAFIAFSSKMTAYLPFGEKGAYSDKVVTDIEKLISGSLPDTDLWDAIFGVTAGAIGEISGFLIILAFIWLIIRKNVSSEIAISYIFTIAIFSYFFPGLVIETDIIVIKYAVYQVFCGGTLFAAVFFASDPAFAPRSFKSKIAVGVIGGLFLMLCRKFVGGMIPCAVSVIAMNLVSPFLDMLFSDGEIFGGRPSKSTK